VSFFTVRFGRYRQPCLDDKMLAPEATMNKALKDAIREVETLPEADQEELAHAIQTMAARKRIDAELAASEAEGGEIPNEEVFRELMRKAHG
jgi:hypothetical protein